MAQTARSRADAIRREWCSEIHSSLLEAHYLSSEEIAKRFGLSLKTISKMRMLDWEGLSFDDLIHALLCCGYTLSATREADDTNS
jgi:hypothetical protein